MNDLNYRIVEADKSWMDRYRGFCQKAYEQAYPRPEHGITKELFSKEIFDSSYVREYFEKMFSPPNKVWLALNKEDQIAGGIAASEYPDYIEMKGFYVDPELKGKGIGRALYDKALDFADGKSIQAWVYEYLDETINMYEHWGFKIDKTKGKLAFNWDPWPKDVKMYAICMTKPAGNEKNK